MLRTSLLAALMLASAQLSPASAQQGVQAGILECRSGGTVGFIIGSVTELSCIFRPDFGPIQPYRATLSRAGVDVGATAVSALTWAVFAPTQQLGLGDLSGNYGGVTAGATVVVGAGANVLYGGSNNSVALQPLSVEGSVGLNVFAGVAGMTLRFAP
ncbi:DUF992 domain-containing protein [Pseudorhodoplanes sp.]|uniref:DUF992 domain-containing protein n=1 Tax=Pseudorhodoplanes sp. TaxID=1934341 RepID=UPI002C9F8277|nr:DUF992 domain-containing protein [Pseudorhodoplanes sp.]HWV40727.1 DUF992 domain-containing protein [Pseudorhodoplanes sp.]